MNQTNDLDVLIGGYLDGQLSPEQLAVLTERLSVDRDAVEIFTTVATADVLIEQHFRNAEIDATAARWLKQRRFGRLQPVTAAECSACEMSEEPLGPSSLEAQATAAVEPRSGGLRLLLAASLLLVLVGGALIAGWQTWSQRSNDGIEVVGVPSSNTMSDEIDAPVLATLISTQHVEWSDGQSMTVGRQLSTGESIRIGAGLVELGLEAGGALILKGPAELEFVSPLQAILHRGTVTAKIEPSAQGFRVDTPNANVVDLGTEFGVAVNDGGETDVVVFSGRVEMQIPDDAPGPTTNTTAQATLAGSRLMLSGDGLRVRSSGVSRLVAINSSEYPTSVSELSGARVLLSVIESVSDNLREVDTTKCYRIVPHGLAEDAVAYVDRDHEWNGVDEKGIPEFLVGADYVMPFNDDKLVDRLEVRISFAAPARLYVFVDERVPTPNWIQRQFVNTGKKIGLDEGDFPNVIKKTGAAAGESIDNVCNVWMMEVPGAGPVTLGSLGVSEEFTSMYGIAATPIGSAP